MPDTPLGFTYPASTGHSRLWEHLQELANDVDAYLALPDEVVVDIGLDTNLITATAFAALPKPVAGTITNPSSTYALLVDVVVQAWVTASASDVRVSVAASGGVTFPATPGSGGPRAFGEVMIGGTVTTKQHLDFSVEIPPGAAPVTFQVQAMRSAATGTQTVNYTTMRIKPRRFLIP